MKDEAVIERDTSPGKQNTSGASGIVLQPSSESPPQLDSELGGEQAHMWLPRDKLVVNGIRLGFHVWHEGTNGFVPIVHAGEPRLLGWRSQAVADTGAFDRHSIQPQSLGPVLVQFDRRSWPRNVPQAEFRFMASTPGAEPTDPPGYDQSFLDRFRVAVQHGSKRNPVRFKKDSRHNCRWSLVSVGCDAPLAIAWAVAILVSLAAWVALLVFALVNQTNALVCANLERHRVLIAAAACLSWQVAAENEQVMQGRQPADYYAVLVRYFLLASSTSLFVAESFKIFLLTIISQQYLPNVAVVQRRPGRIALRLCFRGLLGILYALLRSL